MHLIFPFFKGKLSHLNYPLDVRILHFICPEILVQTLGDWVKDDSSLHLLWFFLHEYFNSNGLIIPKNSISIFFKSNPRLLLFLYNSHVYEYVSILFFLSFIPVLIPDYRYSFKTMHTNKIVILAYSCIKTNLVVLYI